MNLFFFSLASKQKILKDDGASPLDSKFSRLVNQTLELWHVPGISVSIVDGEDVWAEVQYSFNSQLL